MSKTKAISNKKIVSNNQINSINKYYNVAKILLAMTPFMCLMYLSMEGSKTGVLMPELIQQNPKFTIMFLISMINPFIAYLLMFIHRKIEEGDGEYAVTNLTLFVIEEIMLNNVLYAILFGFILYKTTKTYNVTIKDSFEKKSKEKFLMTISGSLVVLVLAGICLFATIRINM